MITSGKKKKEINSEGSLNIVKTTLLLSLNGDTKKKKKEEVRKKLHLNITVVKTQCLVSNQNHRKISV